MYPSICLYHGSGDVDGVWTGFGSHIWRTKCLSSFQRNWLVWKLPNQLSVQWDWPTFKMAASNTYQHRGASWTPQWLLICCGDSMRLEILTEKWFRIFALLTWKLTSRRQGKESSKPVKSYSSFLSHYIGQSNHRAHAGSWGWRNRALIESRGETL